MIKWCLNIILLLGISFSFGQTLNIHLDKDEVQIGEPFTLTYSVISDVKLDSLKYFKYEDFFPGRNSDSIREEVTSEVYEIEISKDFSDTNYQEGSEFIWKGSYELIAWDSAYVIIPPEIIKIKDSIHVFPAGLIYVMSPEIDVNKPIYDINESFTDLPDKNNFLKFLEQNWWWIGIVMIAIVAGIIYFVKRARRTPAPISLSQKSLILIDELEKSKLYEENLKEYYFELSVILRRFLAGHYQTSIMDKTTVEIEVLLAENGLDKEMIVLTRKLLMQSDMVKFARSVPPLVEIQSVTNDARKVISEVTNLELTNEN